MSLAYLSSRPSRWLVGVSAMLALPAAMANERVQVVTSFSILADMVENVGGEHVEVTPLVAADGDAHVYSPSPGDARSLANADLVVFNGLLFEGWMERLISASDYNGPMVTATDGIEPLSFAAHEEHGHDDHDEHDHGHDDHDHEEHADEHAGHDHGNQDPHAWQDMHQAEVYIANIRDGLIAADADNADAYRANAEQYLQEMAEVDDEIRALIDEIPASTSVITGHDSFGYFSSAYGVTFLSPVGLSTEADPSGASMAALVDVIEQENVKALFHENMTNQSIITQLAEETGLPIAGTLYADALAAEGEASTYLGMMRHNAHVLHDALAQPGHNDHDDHGHSH
ncbi:zinc ABC transporter substrate-binding protein [Vreelandella titanicae]|jgi:zinc/manganese transport system substrate-binding protein|uniref:ABC transporter, metal-binding lipoprotein n=1 Tax=Vreelandella titanicae BH1 TaxID=1204738 RepID=L9U774_9GAMM|nr:MULTISPECIES: zinc ABC transporter substrate-binding protein [Halomonas]ELY20642.1 ABC transporter, metal-binding lipoprotein [Halomonas titanicae BH1]KIN13827.1 ABC transporter substrate-binding protein [Halomonas sp. KHS3]NVE91657.1 zinc ABC transporter substrate-binding protein [Halomonas titanicae]